MSSGNEWSDPLDGEIYWYVGGGRNMSRGEIREKFEAGWENWAIEASVRRLASQGWLVESALTGALNVSRKRNPPPHPNAGRDEAAKEIYRRLERLRFAEKNSLGRRYWDLVEHPTPDFSNKADRMSAWWFLTSEGYIRVVHRDPGGERYFGIDKPFPGVPKKCIVKGCTNREGEGLFIGELCGPCHIHVTTGEIGPTKSFLGGMKSELDALRTERVKLLRKDRLGYTAEVEPNMSDLGPVNDSCFKQHTGEVRVTSSTGGQKGQKPQRYGLIPPEAMDVIARVYGYGAEKYSDDNWRKGYDWSLSYDAMQRHLHAFWSGENNDPESLHPHLAHAAFHINTLLVYSGTFGKYGQFDDRPKL